MKAIIILDNIDETEIAELRANVQLNLYGEDRGEYTNCPLKPIPERQELFGNEWERLTKTYGRGWNDCLEELLGENNED